MANTAQFSTTILANIALLHEDVVIRRFIATGLFVSKSGVQKTMVLIKNTGSAKQLRCTGRPRVTKPKTNQFIQCPVKVTPTISSAHIRAKLYGENEVSTRKSHPRLHD